jgi:hypothetical protein
MRHNLVKIESGRLAPVADQRSSFTTTTGVFIYLLASLRR